jgi:hypothetical protein
MSSIKRMKQGQNNGGEDGDRFISNRSLMDIDMSHHNLCAEIEDDMDDDSETDSPGQR